MGMLPRKADCREASSMNSEPIMQNEHFDLNDIHHEPTDEQLEALMALVAAAARERADAARRELMARLRAEIKAAKRWPETA